MIIKQRRIRGVQEGLLRVLYTFSITSKFSLKKCAQVGDLNPPPPHAHATFRGYDVRDYCPFIPRFMSCFVLVNESTIYIVTAVIIYRHLGPDVEYGMKIQLWSYLLHLVPVCNRSRIIALMEESHRLINVSIRALRAAVFIICIHTIPAVYRDTRGTRRTISVPYPIFGIIRAKRVSNCYI